ncbi:MAG: flagellar hook protein FlgE [Firmicutes bacterium]|nr:flagellar hook protein FlgE [Bacillota bacterium]
MMRSLFAGVSGLRNHQTRMDVIGNNIANVNTVGFKSSQVTFQDALSQTLRGASAAAKGRGGTNPHQVGLGMTIGSVSINHTQGSTQPTGKPTDLALEGDGFFVLRDGARQYYTRAGTFSMDEQGNLVNEPNGMLVVGWNADAKGNIDINKPVDALKIPIGDMIQPNATSQLQIGGNLDANVNGQFRLGGTSKITLKDTDTEYELNVTVKPTGEFNKFEMEISVITGELTIGDNPSTNSVSISFTVEDGELKPSNPSEEIKFYVDGINIATIGLNNATDGKDLFDITVTDMEVFQPTMDYAAPQVTQQSQVFDSNGNSHIVTTVFTKISDTEWKYEANVPGGANPGRGTLVFTNGGTISSVAVDDALTFTPPGADPVTIALDYSAMTKYAGESDAYLLYQDGYPTGVLEGFSIDGQGILTGEYSNGLTKALGQVAVARFTNPAGLLKAGENAFAESNNSGKADIKVAGIGGRGSITPGALEMSNVDLSQEFTEMIITQRGFQANSRVITASDEMLQELVNLKR